MSDLPSQTPAPSKRVSKRILLMLRPHWGRIALAVVLLLMSLPAELFPGLTWMYVTDHLILLHDTRASLMLDRLFSFNGRLTGNIRLLFSSITWMFAVYLFYHLCGTLLVSGAISGLFDITTMFSIACLSSRTLPGQP